ncbi:MAG TPA: peptidoglycan DD-metalloendopeptidase family protein [Candidatus Dormibacteraeota bacterium]|nr:peptidoglycan DD-metalloendopeptidase family protein [Candidatus Dormibacteraeota bacterium]
MKTLLGRRSMPRRLGQRAVLSLVLLSSFGGVMLSSTPLPVSADSLSDAYARQRALQKLIAEQKAAIANLNASQAALSNRISNTKASLNEINANLLSVKIQVVSMVVDVARSQQAVDELEATSAQLDQQLADIQAEEATKQAELDASKALLASRIRESYDTDRISTLQTLLSSADFTDALTEVGYHLDFAQQDKLLVDQIVQDQQVLTVLQQNVQIARDQTSQLHDLAAASKQTLDKQLADLAAARKQLAAMEASTAALLAQQNANYSQLQHDKAKLAASLAAQVAEQKKLEALIAKLVAQALARGGIPSIYNGTLAWPMTGQVTQEFGCTGFWAEPPLGNCAHFHKGIDIANAMNTPIYAAGPGKVIWAGRSPFDPAWIVIIAHSSHLVTWYGHINSSPGPTVHAGEYVAQGQLIAYEACTGYCTGPHLHWAVQLDGNWANPRLFVSR